MAQEILELESELLTTLGLESYPRDALLITSERITTMNLESEILKTVAVDSAIILEEI